MGTLGLSLACGCKGLKEMTQVLSGFLLIKTALERLLCSDGIPAMLFVAVVQTRKKTACSQEITCLERTGRDAAPGLGR